MWSSINNNNKWYVRERQPFMTIIRQVRLYSLGPLTNDGTLITWSSSNDGGIARPQASCLPAFVFSLCWLYSSRGKTSTHSDTRLKHSVMEFDISNSPTQQLIKKTFPRIFPEEGFYVIFTPESCPYNWTNIAKFREFLDVICACKPLKVKNCWWIQTELHNK